ncbi:MAG: hypothetical protein ACPGSM_15935 [Thiolinea sp.]
MEIKLFEVRDKGTCLPVIAIQLTTVDPSQKPWKNKEFGILHHAGFTPYYAGEHPYVLMAGLAGGTDQFTCDPHQWGNRTRIYAHAHIIENWNNLTSGDVIDVEFILGEVDEPKESEIQPSGAD